MSDPTSASRTWSWPEIVALAENIPASAINLSGMSLALLFAAVADMENPANWAGLNYTPTPEEQDEIDAAVAAMEDEIMSALDFGSMAFQDADAVDIDGGSIDNTPIGAAVPAPINGTLIEASTGVRVNAAPGIALAYSLRRNGVLRFLFNMTATAESGGNAGSALAISAFDDAGALIRTFLSFDRASAILTLNGPINVGGDLRHVGANFGIRGAAATAAPSVTGSRGGNVALASLLAALAAQNIIVDNTTA